MKNTKIFYWKVRYTYHLSNGKQELRDRIVRRPIGDTLELMRRDGGLFVSEITFIPAHCIARLEATDGEPIV